MGKYVETIQKIFVSNGFSIVQNTSEMIDFAARHSGKVFSVSVKRVRTETIGMISLQRSVEQIEDVSGQLGTTPVLVVLAVVTRKQRKLLKENYGCIIIDVQNLLYMVRTKHELRAALLAELEYSVVLMLPEKPELDIQEPILIGPIGETDAESTEMEEDSQDSDLTKERRDIGGLIDLLKDWEIYGKGRDYEDICVGILQRLFIDDLTLWNIQKNANDGLFRFDLICKIKNGNIKEFWRMAERYFDSKYIVFEFKNYTGKIGQREIFTTVKYLYRKALRGVAILISTHGTDTHGEQAIRGILRDEGKLILALTNQDLINMLRMKLRNEDPADYLSEQLDTMLISLEK